jgi:hypothetical protein
MLRTADEYESAPSRPRAANAFPHNRGNALALAQHLRSLARVLRHRSKLSMTAPAASIASLRRYPASPPALKGIAKIVHVAGG